MTLYDLTRDWKREHQTALTGAIALGAFVCFVFAFLHTKVPRDWMDYNFQMVRGPLGWHSEAFNTFTPSTDAVLYLLGLILWTAFGGLIGGSVVYITQLLRR